MAPLLFAEKKTHEVQRSSNMEEGCSTCCDCGIAGVTFGCVKECIWVEVHVKY